MRTILFLSLAVSLFADEFPKPFNTGTDVGKKPMSADEAVKLIKMPEGFKATVFAAEPDVQNPIACAWDSRGRLWIAENYSYSDASVGFDKNLRDRILIFEDTDNDGKHDKRTVFADNLHNLSSIELGYGGVYATAAPYLLWIPDADGDDKPDAPKDEKDSKDKKDASLSSYKSFPSLNGTSTKILIDGFDAGGVRHNFVNGLRWGPDGWLYGRHGILATSKVGTPGTPDAERLPINVGIWRWHPTRHTVEMVTYGGTNPWGLDFNAEGEGFFTNTVTGHLYHMIPGAHYERMYGEDPNPYIYQLLPQTADHYHYDRSKNWTASRDGAANDFGGGHAHVGCMIYQGENWPEQYRGKVMTINLHGRCINVDRLERKGSGYTAKHEPNMITFGDPWFRGNELTYGPDGGVYVLDWSDQGECHENDGVHRESGRIYKITYGEVKRPSLGAKGDVAKMDADDLVDSVTSRNEWVSRQSRQQIAVNRDYESVRDAIKVLKNSPVKIPATEFMLRQLWAIHGEEYAQPTINYPNENLDGTILPAPVFDSARLRNSETLGILIKIIANENESEVLRAWGIRLIGDWYLGELPIRRKGGFMGIFWGHAELEYDAWKFGNPGYEIDKLIDRTDLPILRRELLLFAMRSKGGAFVHYPVPPHYDNPSFKAPVAFGKLQVDATDPFLPILIWQAGVTSNPFDARSHAFGSRVPQLRQNGARIATEMNTWDKFDPYLYQVAAQALGASGAPSGAVPDIVIGMHKGMAGRQTAPKPRGWEKFSKEAANFPEVADKLRELNVIFGDGRALDEIRALALDSKAEIPARKQAVESLIAAKPDDLRATLENLIATDRELMGAALRGMAVFDDAGPFIATNYQRLRPDLRAAVVPAMCSRAAFALALLDAVANGKIARSDITPYHARQIAALADEAVNKRLAEVWGTVATTSDQKKARMAEVKAALTPDVLAKADIENGRTIYTQTCAACHTLYDLGQAGVNLGPNLTGSGRSDINYLLENIVDPSALVPADYKLSTVTLKDGRVLSGFISAQNAQTLTLRTMTETQTLDRTTVAKTEASAQSLMPEGILDALKPEQIRDLFGFLMKK